MTMTTHRIAGLHGNVDVTARDLDDLKASLEGRLLHAGDDDWDDAVLVWNGMMQRAPRSFFDRPRPETSQLP